jgi:hypothetical protein
MELLDAPKGQMAYHPKYSIVGKKRDHTKQVSCKLLFPYNEPCEFGTTAAVTVTARCRRPTITIAKSLAAGWDGHPFLAGTTATRCLGIARGSTITSAATYAKDINRICFRLDVDDSSRLAWRSLLSY